MKATKLNIIEEEKKVFTAIKNIPAINKKVSISENIVHENIVMKEPPIVSSSSPFKRTLSISSKFKL